MKPRYGLLLISAVLTLAACGGKEKPPLTPDMTEDPIVEDAGATESEEPSEESAPAN